MKDRLEIQNLLEDALGSSNVYYQAPPNTGMKYPCIVYRLVRFNRNSADNSPYIVTRRWEIQHMYKSIKNDLTVSLLSKFPFGLEFDRRLVTDGIYNDYYTLNL